MYKTLKVELKNRITTITLNRPDVLNAFNTQMLEELLLTLDQADNDDEVRVIVITGEGRAFCAGADLSAGDGAFEGDNIQTEEARDTGGILSLKLYQMRKPIIAAINGAAVGVGITMTLPMDIRIISNDAKIGFVFTRRGIGPEACSGWFLPKIVGIAKASEWVLTGRMITPSEALDHGLVHGVVHKEDVLTKAYEIASEIVRNTSAVSVAFSRQLLWNMVGENDPRKSHLLESEFLHWAGSRADAKEGVQSFLEKRAPHFSLSVTKDMPSFFDD
ncbi:enoyl-CoA hydratase-related protein [Alkalihalophilus lindianensis]|uniref:Enoyl-CoA hydratase-related protein n=1 Tax=Alkalihalophilus lindianensis TaxID=1630542 RepID=A0ABU3XDY5_9BACI|nr:enoyl-CoA hydratase-related protein [Alkalihalophilus lindianensis]MDV2686090.1 enoyl-CoA hydratase-related protein [Alkalihalophilus lindianensis]